MALEVGTRLGHYEVVSSLGAEGMGEVYRAKDTKLGREVAIKLLPEEVRGRRGVEDARERAGWWSNLLRREFLLPIPMRKEGGSVDYNEIPGPEPDIVRETGLGGPQ